jgi:hypothetical protein
MWKSTVPREIIAGTALCGRLLLDEHLFLNLPNGRAAECRPCNWFINVNKAKVEHKVSA